MAPVFFKFGVDDFDLEEMPPEAMDMAKEAMGGFQSASFGDEADLDELVFMPNVDSSDEEDLPLVAAAAAAAAGAVGEGEAAVLAAAGEIPMHDLDEEDTEVRK